MKRNWPDCWRDYLEQSGYRTFCMGSGRNAAALVQTSTPDIVLAGLMLPEKVVWMYARRSVLFLRCRSS
jgi:DNA-binding response OmpR family regulator